MEKMRAGNSAIEYRISFEAFGVKVGVELNDDRHLPEISRRLGEVLPGGGLNFIEQDEAERVLKVRYDGKNGFEIYKDGERINGGENAENLPDFLESQIRLTVAEYAAGKVFLHAGAVGWKEQAVIIPASSFSGKTTLVAELIKKGATYYSDEYAVLDENGLVHPFPKSLSMRGILDDYRQVERPAKSFGATVGETPLPVGMVLICKFKKSEKQARKFVPKILSEGQGMLEILAHTIPIRYNPKFALKILNKVASRAIIAKFTRGEAKEFADFLVKYLDETF